MTTRYEVALTKNGKFVRSLGYSARHTKAALMSFARYFGAEVLALITDAEADADYRYADGVLSFGSASVAFSGYTERNPRTA